jgi:hypothetical protein
MACRRKSEFFRESSLKRYSSCTQVLRLLWLACIRKLYYYAIETKLKGSHETNIKLGCASLYFITINKIHKRDAYMNRKHKILRILDFYEFYFALKPGLWNIKTLTRFNQSLVIANLLKPKLFIHIHVCTHNAHDLKQC